MKSKIIVLTGWLLIPVIQLSAQLDSFDLSRYKLPEIKRIQLDFNTSSQLIQSRDNADLSKNLNWNGQVQTTLSSYINKEKYQGSGSLSFHINPTNSSNSNANQDNKGKGLSSSFNINSGNRFFFNNQFFVETNFQAGIGLNTASSPYSSLDGQGNLISRSDNDGALTNTALSADIFIGKGRIEPVEDARLAIYILQDLQKLNCLTRIPGSDEILEFSALISQLKNKRYFDSRLHKIAELKEIDQFLRGKGIIKENDIAYFAAVNDNWDYASGPVRLTGSKFYAGLTPSYLLWNRLVHYYQYDNTLYRTAYNKNQDDNLQLGLAWLAGYQYNKPVKLYWQISYGALVVYSSSDTRIIDRVAIDTIKTRLKQLNPQEYFNIGFYPNSRTFFSGGITLMQSFNTNYDLYTPTNSWNKGTQMNNYSASLNLNFYYYLSPQLRLNGTWYINSGLAYDRTNSTGRNSFTQNLNIGLIYSIF
jgi:hypothetical protein